MDITTYTEAFEASLKAPLAPLVLPDLNPYQPLDNAETEPRDGITIAYAHVDYGDEMWDRIERAFKLCAGTVYPQTRLVNLPFKCEKQWFLLAQAQVYARIRRSLRGNMMFLDTDVLCNVPADPFVEDFDIGLTTTAETFPLMPFNAGVVFAKDTPAAQEFMDAVMAFANHYPVVDSFWYLNQIALAAAYMRLKDRVKIKVFPHELYNFAPNGIEPTAAHFIHLKGNRKGMLVDFLRQVMRRHGKSEAVALEGKLLQMSEPTPDENGLRQTAPNIRANVARGLPKYAPVKVHDRKVAIVGYGPSLLETWEQLKDFDGDIWTTSKAHDFLVERGIVPTFHTDIDYREHKAGFIKRVNGETRYIIATQVHPKYLDNLLSHPDVDVELFHTGHDGHPQQEPGRGYPEINPMYDAGLQLARMAYRAGYRQQEWFGLDASLANGQSHAGPHEGVLGSAPGGDVLVSGRVYASNGLLIRQALFCERFLCKYPFLVATIHGDGMLRPFLQERGKAVVR